MGTAGRRVQGPLQFVPGGHVLAFSPGTVNVAGGNHALRVDFVGSRSVTPVSEYAESAFGFGRADPLGKVTYANLWNGISLVYSRQNGAVAKSGYYVAPRCRSHSACP